MKNKGNPVNPVLLVDDEMQTLISYSVILKSTGIKEVVTIEDSRKVMPFLSKQSVALIVLDLSMPFISGQELLTKINEEFPEIPVLIVTATNDIEVAIECMQKGATDYLVKPVEKNRFVSSIKRALEIRNLKSEVSTLKHYLLTDDLKYPAAFSHIVTASKNMQAIFKYIEAIAHSPFPVLITGETGVGKELMAKAIHLSNPNSKTFVAVNVAGLDDSMFSDTLFGHQKGAFTGADTKRDGLIVQAEGGTLFLDEIGDLNSLSQVKLLRLIQEKEYYQLGSDLTQKANTRVVVTSNKDLKKLVENGLFRKDLYFRLSAHQIKVPPLRERKEDIPVLVHYFLEEAALSMNKKKITPPPELMTLLTSYTFPGNVRELQAFIYDAVSRHKSGILSMESFKEGIKLERGIADVQSLPEDDEEISINRFLTSFPTLKQAEEFLINRALKQSNGNQGIAASILGITRQALNKRLIRKKERDKDTN
jgi:DNA-binding NtrC family response regulator